MAAHRLCLMYTMDPRGTKVGGIETHVRLILRHHPADFSLLFIGIDERGDLALGRVHPVTIGGRRVDFLPVAHVPEARVNRAAKALVQSTTVRYVLGALRHLGTIRAAIGLGPASADLHRFEFALLAQLLGVPVAQMVHGEGSKGDQMDSLIKRYWFIHAFNERLALRLADRIFCVNDNILHRLEAEFPRAVAKAEVLTVSVDTGLFRPTPFDTGDDVLRIAFAGRLDAFKDPPLIFRTLALLRQRLQGRVEFHYVGASDPAQHPDFAAIADRTIRHGFQDAPGVARILGRCHAGILASYFEGMPCFLLETLSAGRPFAAIRLPQYDPLIEAGVSGHLVERGSTLDDSAERLATAFVALWSEIRAGAIDPQQVHRKILPYAVESQMGRLFARHRALQDARRSGSDGAREPAAPRDATISSISSS